MTDVVAVEIINAVGFELVPETDITTVGLEAPFAASSSGGGAVDSVNAQTGVVVLDAGDIAADSTTLVGTGTTVQAVLEELDNGIAAAYTPGGTDVAVADGGTGASTAAAARAALGVEKQFHINVKESPYNATGDGTTDDTAAIQAALTAANTAGGGTVLVPAGTYKVVLQAATPIAGQQTALTIYSNTTLVLARGATIKLAASQSAGTNPNNAIIRNSGAFASSSFDHDILITGEGTIDGNAANNSTALYHGIYLGTAQRVGVEGITVKNCRGNSAGSNTPLFETLHVNFYRCANYWAKGLHVFMDDAGPTASGIGSNFCTSGYVADCDVHHMTYGVGITHYDSSHVVTHNCHSYKNGGNGFLTEHSEHITFSDCIAGGIASDDSQSGNTTAIYDAGTYLGNCTDHTNLESAGFYIDAGQWITIDGCESSYQDSGSTSTTGTSGIKIVGGTGTVRQVKIDNTRVYGNVKGLDFTHGDGTVCVERMQNTLITSSCVIGPNTGQAVSGSGAKEIMTTLGAGTTASGLLDSIYQTSASYNAVPASGVALVNPFPFACDVVIHGGVVTNVGITVNGTTSTASAPARLHRLPQGASITLTYTAAPTWDWFAFAGGVASTVVGIGTTTARPAASAVEAGSLWVIAPSGSAALVADDVAAVTQNSGSTANSTVTFTATTTAGNHVILAVESNNNQVLSSVSDSAGNTWQVDKTSPTGQGPVASMASCKVTTGHSIGSTLTLTFAGTVNYVAGVCSEWSGLDQTTWVDITASATGASSPAAYATAVLSAGVSQPIPTRTQPDDLVIGAVAYTGTSSPAIYTGDGFTALTSKSCGSNNKRITPQYKVIDQGGAQHVRWNTNPSGFEVVAVAYKAVLPARSLSMSDGVSWTAVSGGSGATNLSYTAAPTNGVVTSDTGTDATVTLADGTNAGLMAPAGFTKLAGIETGATADQTAAEILAALVTVDGAGSGLDADTLDGTSSAGFATASGLSDHLSDTSDAHDASAVSIADAGGYYTGTEVEAALQEAGLTLAALGDVATLQKLLAGMTVPRNALDKWKAGPGNWATKLNGSINSSVTTVTVDNTSFTPDTTKRVIRIDEEDLWVTAGFGSTSLTVVRGVNGTTAASHSDRAVALLPKHRRVVCWGDSITLGTIPSYADGYVRRASRVLSKQGGGLVGDLWPLWHNSTADADTVDWSIGATMANSTAGINYDVGAQGSVLISGGSSVSNILYRRAGVDWAEIYVPWVDYGSTAPNWSYSINGGSTWVDNPIATAGGGGGSIWSSGVGLLRVSKITVDNPDDFRIRPANVAGTSATIAMPYSGVWTTPTPIRSGRTEGHQWLNLGYGGMRLRITLNSRTVTDGSVTNGSPTVTSATAAFVTNYDAGSTIYIQGVSYLISTRDSATQITLTTNYAGTTGTGKRLTIFAGDHTGDRFASFVGHHGSWVPDLIIMGPWINDIVNGGASHDTTKGDENPDAMTDMLNYFHSKVSDFADVMYVGCYEFNTTSATSGLQQQYRDAIEAVAAANNAAYLDLYAAFSAYGTVGYSAMSSGGFMYDSVHLSAKGNRWIGSHYARVLGVI